MNRWERNIWTGADILRINQNTRVIRHGLYRAEYWGDFSLAFPVYGPWRKTLVQAKRDIPDITTNPSL